MLIVDIARRSLLAKKMNYSTSSACGHPIGAHIIANGFHGTVGCREAWVIANSEAQNRTLFRKVCIGGFDAWVVFHR